MYKRLVLAFIFVLTAFIGASGKMYGLFLATPSAELERVNDNEVIELAKLYRKNGGDVILIGQDAARKSVILKYLKTQAEAAKEDDILVFIYAGHGGKGFIACNGTCSDGVISYDEIKKVMNLSKADRKILITDACYGGTALETRTKLKGKNVICMSATSKSDYAYNGIFLTVIIDGLKNKRADLNHDGKVTAKELHDYIQSSVEMETPLMKGRFDDNFIIYTCGKRANVDVEPKKQQGPIVTVTATTNSKDSILTLKDSVAKAKDSVKNAILKPFDNKPFNGKGWLILSIFYIIVFIIGLRIIWKLILGIFDLILSLFK